MNNNDEDIFGEDTGDFGFDLAPQQPQHGIVFKIIRGILTLIASLVGICFYLGGIALHIWTVIVAFMMNGFLSAFITFMIPFISEIYWAWKSISLSGSLINNYTILILAYIVLLVITFGCASIVAKMEEGY